jgi:hypothetical protein
MTCSKKSILVADEQKNVFPREGRTSQWISTRADDLDELRRQTRV